MATDVEGRVDEFIDSTGFGLKQESLLTNQALSVDDHLKDDLVFEWVGEIDIEGESLSDLG